VKNLFKEKLKEIVKKHSGIISNNCIFFTPNIPEKKMYNALRAYAFLEEDEKALLLIDETIFGGAKEGVLLSDRKLYIHALFERPRMIDIADIKSVKFVNSKVDRMIYINDKRFYYPINQDALAIEQFCQMLREIISYAGSCSLSNYTSDDSSKELSQHLEDTINRDIFKPLPKSPDKAPKLVTESQQLTQEWKTIRVFISSTFRDMHAERDYLARVVFPELKERCAKKHLHLIDLDLRWGVTEEEAEHGKIVDTILEEIDRSRPFFIAILGERYGSVIDNISEDAKFTYPWLTEYEEHSYTALEIVHGVLRRSELSGRSFFYFRNPQFILKVPDSKRSDYHAENTLASSKLVALKDKIRASGRPVMENYPCSWDDNKESIKGLDAFGQRVLEDLWNAICAEYPKEAPEADPITTERQMHGAFAEDRSSIHVGRIKQEEHLTKYLQGTDRRPVVITGESGCGKSAFIASWSKKYMASNPDTFILTYFIGASPSSANYHLLLRNMCEELKRAFKLREEIPEDDKKLSETLAMSLVAASKSKSRVIIVLDGLDQLSLIEGVGSLSWLLDYIPEKTRLVLSSLEGDFLDVLKRRQAEEIALPPLNKDEQKQIVQTLLCNWHRKLDNNQIEELLRHSGVNNPLYLRVALEELRLFGSFEKLMLKINKLAEDIPGLFGQVLERLEEDHGKKLVSDAFSLIGSSRYGLSESELLELLRRKDEKQFPRVLWARLTRSTKMYLVYRGELIEFFHRQLADAVHIRYLKQDNKHDKLADYFSSAPIERKLDEYPYQLHKAMDRGSLAAALSDLDFFSYAWEHNRKYEWIGYWNALKGKFEPGSSYLSAINKWISIKGETQEIALLLHKISVFLNILTQLEPAALFEERAIIILEKLFGPDHIDIAASCSCLAEINIARSRFADALSLYHRTLIIQKRALGSKHKDVATTLFNLGILYFQQSNWSEGITFYYKAKDIYEPTFLFRHSGVANDPDLIDNIDHLARWNMHAHQFSKAASLYKRLVDIQQRILSPDSPELGQCFIKLAAAYINQGKDADALPLCQRALLIFERALGPDDICVGSTLRLLAKIHRDKKNYTEAEYLCQRALLIFERALGPDHLGVADLLEILGKVYILQRRYYKALPLLLRAKVIYEHTLAIEPGTGKVGLKVIFYDLIIVYTYLGSEAKTLSMLCCALKIENNDLWSWLKADLSGEWRYLLIAVTAFGIFLTFGLLSPIYWLIPIVFYIVCLFRWKNLYPSIALLLEYFILYLIHWIIYIINSFAILNLKSQLSLNEHALKINERFDYAHQHGFKQPDIADVLNTLADHYRLQGKYSKALPLIERALKVREGANSADHPDAAIYLCNLADVYFDLDKYAQALPHYQQALKIAEAILGSQHHNTERFRMKLKVCQDIIAYNIADV